MSGLKRSSKFGLNNKLQKIDYDEKSSTTVNTASCSFTIDSAAYCDGYNDSIYQIMQDDTYRTSFYRQAISKYCKNKTVMDIGCGSFCLLSIIAAECGAKKVYAIETNKESFKNANNLISEKNKHNESLKNKIELINAHSMELNNIKCDVIVHEIIGEFASSEGVYAVIKDAKQRLLCDCDGSANNSNVICSIPDYAETYLTPVEFPDYNYWKSLPNKVIVNKDIVSMNLWNFPQRHCLSYSNENNKIQIEWALWEHINFNQICCNDKQRFKLDRYTFIAQKNGIFGGLLSSIKLVIDPCDESLVLCNKLNENNCHWANKLIILDKKIEVKKGQKIIVCAKTDPNDCILKYEFKVMVQ